MKTTYEEIEIGDIVQVIHIDTKFWIKIVEKNVVGRVDCWVATSVYPNINSEAAVHRGNFRQFFNIDELVTM